MSDNTTDYRCHRCNAILTMVVANTIIIDFAAMPGFCYVEIVCPCTSTNLLPPLVQTVKAAALGCKHQERPGYPPAKIVTDYEARTHNQFVVPDVPLSTRDINEIAFFAHLLAGDTDELFGDQAQAA